MKISERCRKDLEVKGIRVKKVEQQVDEIKKMLQDNGFTISEGELIVKSLANDVEEAKYHSPMTLLTEIDAKMDPQTAQSNRQ